MSGKLLSVQKLDKAIHDYLSWLKSNGYTEKTRANYKRGLTHFQTFINQREIPWDAVFCFDTFKSFQEKCRYSNGAASVRGLSRFLFKKNKIKRPIERPKPALPHIFDDYLTYCRKVRGVGKLQLGQVGKTLTAFNDYLESGKISIESIKIEEIDSFLVEHNAKYRPGTRPKQRSIIRGFLKYLYEIRGLIERDLASLLISPPNFAHSNPPKFLRPYEIKLLFESLPTETAKDLRTCAMMHVAYTLGLRPGEIALFRLDDISFALGEIILPSRKSFNPIKLPLPEIAIKAIAAYIVGARPKSDRRTLFLSLAAPYGPVAASTISNDISKAMRRAGLRSTAYWLRHTYAQNLLESGASIFEIKEMLGHDSIKSSQRYIHVHTELMRKVLFNETL
ncbi:MAG: tyrosine-type recombinase/integrase [Planctomycetes bacterium]|nr:tyrosine-type recombinase/integrase [Planctomycetota bacterium]